MPTTPPPPTPQYRAQSALIEEPMQPEAISYRSSDVKCPACHQWRRDWRDAAPADPEAVRAHSECTWWAIRVDLRLARCRQGGC
jgi:hypothetical protein